MAVSRRQFCATLAAAAGTARFLPGCADAPEDGTAKAFGFGDSKSDGFNDVRFVESLDICELGLRAELVDDIKPHVKHSRGHNVRLYTQLTEMIPDGRFDLSTIGTADLVVSQDKYYIRTEAPDQLHTATDANIPNFDALDTPNSPYLQPLYDNWRVRISGLVTAEADLWPALLEREVGPMGVAMMDCAGNDKFANFRLMSAAHWEGIAFKDFLEVMQSRSGFGLTELQANATHVRITGFDLTKETRWNRFLAVESTPGASWIFSIQELIEQGAFLATGMQGMPLVLDHGFPLRLVVPRYYGCTCIKWITDIEFMAVDGNTPTTDQMREFSDRTGQLGSSAPLLLKDHVPPVIEQSMTPLKIERWSINGQVAYRAIGVMWGGTERQPDLSLQTQRDGFWRDGPEIELAVDYTPQADTDGFTLWWSEFWRPAKRGKYVMTPMINDPHIPASRVRDGYYNRGVRIRKRS